MTLLCHRTVPESDGGVQGRVVVNVIDGDADCACARQGREDIVVVRRGVLLQICSRPRRQQTQLEFGRVAKSQTGVEQIRRQDNTPPPRDAHLAKQLTHKNTIQLALHSTNC